jgi:hypothetical protein
MLPLYTPCVSAKSLVYTPYFYSYVTLIYTLYTPYVHPYIHLIYTLCTPLYKPVYVTATWWFVHLPLCYPYTRFSLYTSYIHFYKGVYKGFGYYIHQQKSNYFICRRISQQFVNIIVSKLMTTCKTPIMMYISKAKELRKVCFVPTTWSNDNDEAYSLLNMRKNNRTRPCRLCNIPRIHLNRTTVTFSGQFRDGKYLYDLGTRSEPIILKQILAPKNARGTLTDSELAVLDECKLNGIHPGKNDLLLSTMWHAEYGIGDLYSLSVFDNLHTMYKGNHFTPYIPLMYTLCTPYVHRMYTL